MTMTNAGVPTGRKIVRELVQEMEAQLYPLMYRTLPPRAYHVYLHPEDFRAVEAAISLVVADAERALSDRVEELNRRSKLFAFVAGRLPPIEAPSPGWEIHIQPEANGDVVRGEFRIESRLAVPAPPSFNDGVPTVRIGRTVVSGTARRTVVTEAVVPPIPAAAAATIPATTAISSEGTALTGAARTDDPLAGFARLTYTDEQGPHNFVIRKDLVAIGRGGAAHWVDVQIASIPRVSRVHCRIRRDASGRFFLEDLSTWGTSIDGQRAPAYPGTNGAAAAPLEVELPPQARIQLADAVTIEFTALAR